MRCENLYGFHCRKFSLNILYHWRLLHDAVWLMLSCTRTTAICCVVTFLQASRRVIGQWVTWRARSSATLSINLTSRSVSLQRVYELLRLRATLAVLLTPPAEYAQHGLCNGRASVRMSHRLAAADCCWCPVGKRYRSIAARRAAGAGAQHAGSVMLRADGGGSTQDVT